MTLFLWENTKEPKVDTVRFLRTTRKTRVCVRVD